MQTVKEFSPGERQKVEGKSEVFGWRLTRVPREDPIADDPIADSLDPIADNLSVREHAFQTPQK